MNLHFIRSGYAVLLACLLAGVGCNRSNDAAVTRAKAEAEASKAALDKGSSSPPSQRTTSTTSPKQEPHLGTWDWGWGAVDSNQEPMYQNSITVHADGSISEPGGQTGKWERTGNVISLKWGNGTIDTVTISEDGNMLNGASQTGTPVRGRKQ